MALSAGVAVGAGVALARAGRTRRSLRAAKRAGELGLHPGEGLGEGLRRMAIGQADLVIELLEGIDADTHASGPGVSGRGRRWSSPTGGGEQSARKAVHETRKALKRLRAMVRLLEDQLGDDRYERESAALREAGRALAGARDAEVMLQTLEELLSRNSDRLGGRDGVGRLRASLAQERDRLERRTVGDPAARAFVLGELRAFRTRASVWTLADPGGLALIETGLARIYRQGRVRQRRAARAKGDPVSAMHDWRKRVKDLRYAAEMLERRDGHASAGVRELAGKRRRRRRSRALKEGRPIRRIARAADELGELLGEEHDLAVLAQALRGEPSSGSPTLPKLPRGTRKAMLKLIARRRRKLRRRALREGAKLYRRPPKRFLKRIRTAERRAAALSA